MGENSCVRGHVSGHVYVYGGGFMCVWPNNIIVMVINHPPSYHNYTSPMSTQH